MNNDLLVDYRFSDLLVNRYRCNALLVNLYHSLALHRWKRT